MTPSSPFWHSGLSKYIAPTSLGAAYALTKIGFLRWINPDWALEQDFNLQFLAGVLLGFTLRPITKPVFWKPFTEMPVLFLLLIVLGPPGKLLEHYAWGVPFDVIARDVLLAECVAALVLAFITPLILAPSQQWITLAFLLQRVGKFLQNYGWLQIFGLGLAYTGLSLFSKLLFETSFSFNQFPIHWEQLMNIPPVSIIGKISLFWLRGIFCTLVLLPICATLPRNQWELTIILGSILFVIAEFTPAFANFSHIPPYLLLDEVIQGSIRYFGLGALVAAIFRVQIVN